MDWLLSTYYATAAAGEQAGSDAGKVGFRPTKLVWACRLTQGRTATGSPWFLARDEGAGLPPHRLLLPDNATKMFDLSRRHVSLMVTGVFVGPHR